MQLSGPSNNKLLKNKLRIKGIIWSNQFHSFDVNLIIIVN